MTMYPDEMGSADLRKLRIPISFGEWLGTIITLVGVGALLVILKKYGPPINWGDNDWGIGTYIEGMVWPLVILALAHAGIPLVAMSEIGGRPGLHTESYVRAVYSSARRSSIWISAAIAWFFLVTAWGTITHDHGLASAGAMVGLIAAIPIMIAIHYYVKYKSR